MIGHNHPFLQSYKRELCRNHLPDLTCQRSQFGQYHLSILHLPEKMLPVVGADGDEIRGIAPIIPPRGTGGWDTVFIAIQIGHGRNIGRAIYGDPMVFNDNGCIIRCRDAINRVSTRIHILTVIRVVDCRDAVNRVSTCNRIIRCTDAVNRVSTATCGSRCPNRRRCARWSSSNRGAHPQR
jgi:hypothetical protein